MTRFFSPSKGKSSAKPSSFNCESPLKSIEPTYLVDKIFPSHLKN